MVDGGVELRIGVLPLAVQILSAQRTAMAGAGRRRQRTGSTEGGGGGRERRSRRRRVERHVESFCTRSGQSETRQNRGSDRHAGT